MPFLIFLIGLSFFSGCAKDTLYTAVKMGDIQAVKQIIENEDVGELTDVLILSVRTGNLELVKYLVSEKGVDVNATGGRGRRVGFMSPLLWATYHGHKDIVDFLLAEGADPSMKDAQGRDAFSIALDQGFTDLAKSLRYGQNTIVTTKKRITVPTVDIERNQIKPFAQINSVESSDSVSKEKKEQILAHFQNKILEHFSIDSPKKNSEKVWLFTLVIKQDGLDTTLEIKMAQGDYKFFESAYCPRCNNDKIYRRLDQVIDTMVESSGEL